MAGVHPWRALRQRGRRVQDRRENLVIDVDQGRRLPGRVMVGSRDGRHHVAHVPDLFSLGDEPGPVSVNQAVPAVARHIGRGDHLDDAGMGCRTGRVDAPDSCPRVWRQHERAVQQVGTREVGDVRTHAQGEGACIDALQPLADAAARRCEPFQRGLAAPQPCEQLDGVEDLHVARTPAQVDVDRPGDGGACRPRFAIEEPLRPQRDSRNAEAALHAGRCRKRAGGEGTLRGREALECQDVPALRRRGRHRTGHLRVPVDQRQAAATLALGGAPILDRRDAAAFPQDLQQRFVRTNDHPPRPTVQRKGDLAHRSPVLDTSP